MAGPSSSELTTHRVADFPADRGDRRRVRVLILVGLLFIVGFGLVYFQPRNRGNVWLFGLLTASVVVKLGRLLHEWYHYWNVIPPKRPPVTRTWTVDVLTTYCPGEPKAMVLNTLRAIQAMPYPHTTYLCDEASDPYWQQVCREMDIRHVTRTDKTDAKAGNINNALKQATGEICLIIDPDHVPVPDFLKQVLPYFEDDRTGFVQCVQGYSNRKESLVAYGAAEQTYSFYGPMMTCMGYYGTAQAIGANCTFRRDALNSIGGHAPGLSEDMNTAMQLHANGWTSVYVPLPLSYGLVPATMSAYYQQQLKWARGTFELLVTTYPAVFGGLTWRQRLHYLTLPFYYLLGLVQLIDLLIPIIAMATQRLPLRLDLLLFATAYLPLLVATFLIRQYAQRWLIERHESGFHLIGGILSSGTWWVYVLGVVYTVFRVEVPYLPTPKHDRPRNNWLLCLPNIVMILATLGASGYGLYHYGRFALGNLFFRLMLGFGLLNSLILGLNVLIGQEVWLARLKAALQRLTSNKSGVMTARQLLWLGRYGLYRWLRLSAIPLFGLSLLLTTGLAAYTYSQLTLELPHDLQHAKTQAFYYGIESAGRLAKAVPAGEGPLLVVQHLPWPVAPARAIALPAKTVSRGELPLLYLEPNWAQPRSEAAIRLFLNRLRQGRYDPVLTRFAQQLKQYQHPMLLSFAPRFDDASRPWGSQQATTLAMYQTGWQQVVRVFQQQQVRNVTWVWCPSQRATIAQFYPDARYVDWLGIEVDNPVPGLDRSFATRYQLLHNAVRLHTEYEIRQKPVLITRIEPATSRPDQWLARAVETIHERYPEIRGLVLPGTSQVRLAQSVPRLTRVEP